MYSIIKEYVSLIRATGQYNDYQENIVAIFPLDKLEEVEAWVTKNNKIINENNGRAVKIANFIDNTHYFTVIRGSTLPNDEVILYERVVKEKGEREEKERRKLFEELKQIYEGKSKCPN